MIALREFTAGISAPVITSLGVLGGTVALLAPLLAFRGYWRTRHRYRQAGRMWALRGLAGVSGGGIAICTYGALRLMPTWSSYALWAASFGCFVLSALALIAASDLASRTRVD